MDEIGEGVPVPCNESIDGVVTAVCPIDETGILVIGHFGLLMLFLCQ